ncbi:hypothetical protein M011DRAFT_480809 [Sporormia fimetaria CBS 119925]|uniref:Uncharacterized protein n=1 Tax=Sporormia fimetaria CBS 119925 TaxID=1340428 RepID=A0A6A6V0C7_9PLEO|nr:hypothetical protein M011DRAFT_480809 [Sporormia fimetaria CBS 119925]
MSSRSQLKPDVSTNSRVRRLFHRRVDSAYSVVKQHTLPHHLPLNPAAAEHAARMFVEQMNRRNPQAIPAKAVSVPDAPLLSSSAASSRTAIHNGPLDPNTAAVIARHFVLGQQTVLVDRTEPLLQGEDDVSFVDPMYDSTYVDESINRWLCLLEEEAFESQERSTICDEETECHRPDDTTNQQGVETVRVPSEVRHESVSERHLVLVPSNASSSTYPSPLPSPKKRHERLADDIQQAHSRSLSGERKQHEFCNSLAHNTARGSGPAARTLLSILTTLEYSTLSDPVITYGPLGIGFRKSQMSVNDWNWLSRGSLAFYLHKELPHGRIPEEDFDFIFTQILPDERRVKNGPDYLLDRDQFRVCIDAWRREETWCTERLAEFQELQTSEEEVRAGPQVVVAAQGPPVPSTFHGLPMQEGGLNRLHTLRRLIEAMAYERKERYGVRYENAAGFFSLYHSAWSCQQENKPLTKGLHPYARNWTTHESQLLQRGGILLSLLCRVQQGQNDHYTYTMIRGALMYIKGQFNPDLDRFEQFLWGRALDSGVQIDEIPMILIEHRDYNRLNDTERQRRLDSFVDRAESWKLDEERLKEAKQSKKAWKKAHKDHGFRAKIKQAFEKLTGKKPQSRFHCIGCMQGRRCIE